jgi:hypothetical protein
MELHIAEQRIVVAMQGEGRRPEDPLQLRSPTIGSRSFLSSIFTSRDGDNVKNHGKASYVSQTETESGCVRGYRFLVNSMDLLSFFFRYSRPVFPSKSEVKALAANIKALSDSDCGITSLLVVVWVRSKSQLRMT